MVLVLYKVRPSIRVLANLWWRPTEDRYWKGSFDRFLCLQLSLSLIQLIMACNSRCKLKVYLAVTVLPKSMTFKNALTYAIAWKTLEWISVSSSQLFLFYNWWKGLLATYYESDSIYEISYRPISLFLFLKRDECSGLGCYISWAGWDKIWAVI